MIRFVYSVVILIATTLGAFVGLGGGAIIKPVLDFIGAEPRIQVDFLSASAVFTMSIVSTARAVKDKREFKKDIIAFISVGSIAGGWLGSFVMDIISEYLSQNTIRSIQAIILAIFFSLVAFYVSKCNFSFKLKNRFIILLSGLFLGFTASFLGIGGGPINVAFLILLFSLSAKESAVYSVAIIFFSQLTKIITLLITNGIVTYSFQWKTLAFILPAAVIGGFLGSFFNKKFSSETIKKVFSLCMILLVLLNIYNALNYFGVFN